MAERDLGDLYARFEQCLDLAPDQRRARARELCKSDPRQLPALLDLIERDERFDQSASTAGTGLEELTRFALSDTFYKGQVVGSFRIEECIGSGGMGTVYRVSRIDGQVKQQAALKLIDPGRLDRSLLSRFSNERQVLASLEHPGICRFLDAGTLGQDQPYVLMELIEGEPLLRYCDRNQLNLRERVEVFLRILDAVAHAHQRLVVHRDIKSGNILVNREGQPKLLDFGIAKNLAPEGDPQQTQTGEHFFTPRGAAPEQLLGHPIDVACDIYALGQLLYQLLCGQSPFDFSGRRPGEIERLILEQPPQPMVQRSLANDRDSLARLGCHTHRELRRQLRGDLESIVLKCLRKQPGNRYLSTERLAADLRRWQSNRPIGLRRSDRSYRLRKFIARNRMAAGLTSLLALTLLASSIATAWQSARMAHERERALLERDRARHAVAILQQAFESADPAGVLGADVKARDILRAAREPVFALRQTRPELFVSLATVLAEVELSLRETESAAELAEAAVKAAGSFAAAPRQIRPLLLTKARALTNSRRRDKATAVLERIAAMDEEDRADVLHAQGRWHLLGNESERAIRAFEAARQLQAQAQQQTSLEDHLNLGRDLANALSQKGLHDRSLALHDEMLHEIESARGPDDALATLTRMGRIEALIRADRLDQAQVEARTVKRRIEQLYGPNSAWAGRMHGTLGMLHLRRFDAQSAVQHYDRALKIWQRYFNPTHPDIVRVSINLAYAMQHTPEGQEQAEGFYRELLATLVQESGQDNRAALIVRGLLGQLLSGQGRAQDAMKELLGSGAVNEQAAIEVSHWRKAFIQALAERDCPSMQLTESNTESCQWVASQLVDWRDIDSR